MAREVETDADRIWALRLLEFAAQKLDKAFTDWQWGLDYPQFSTPERDSLAQANLTEALDTLEQRIETAKERIAEIKKAIEIEGVENG